MNMSASLSNTETNIKLPFSFIIFSLLAFSIAQVLLLFSGRFMANGIFQIPPMWMVAHLLLLGWALMVVMGAMYQLVPVAFLTPIWNETFGFIQFIVTAIGITSFTLSLSFFPAWIVLTGTITFIGILMFLFQMAMTIRKQPEKNVLTMFIGTALICLLLTILLGIILAISLNGNGFSSVHLAILKTHILLGVGGWFTLLIFGFSYKMVPMFSLAHGFSMKMSQPIYLLYVLGLFLSILSFWTKWNYFFPIGMVLLFVSFTLFSWHIYEILKKRLKKKLDKPFQFSLISILIGWGIHFTVMISSFLPATYFFMGVIIYLYIIGWVIFSIMGYLYKIVPFLWWTFKYSKDIGKHEVPTLKQLMNERLGMILFLICIVCFVSFIFSFYLQLQILYTITQFVFASTCIVYCGQILNILRK